MTAWSRKTWNFCDQFFAFFLKKRSLSNCRYCADCAQNLPGLVPHIWLTLFQISSKSVHFRRSYCRTRGDRFCPVEYLQYLLLEPITISRWALPVRLCEFCDICRHENEQWMIIRLRRRCCHTDTVVGPVSTQSLLYAVLTRRGDMTRWLLADESASVNIALQLRQMLLLLLLQLPHISQRSSTVQCP